MLAKIRGYFDNSLIHQLKHRTAKKSLPYMFILPALIGMLFVHIIPMLWGVVISFLDLDIYNITRWASAPFVGLENYTKGFSPVTTIGRMYFKSLFNVAYYSLLTISIGYFLGLGAALLLNRPFFGRTFIRGLILIPFITPDSVAYNFWRFIFQSRIGILNKMLLDLGLIQENIVWLVGQNSLYAVVIASIWKGWPFAALILLAGLQTIPQEIYEAARIDGASAWQRFRYITFQYLKPVTKTLMIMNILWNFFAFNQFVVLLGRSPGKYAEVPSTLIMRQAFGHFKYGLGAALSIILMLIMLIITIAYLYFFRIRAERE
ncbi:carbohydrate ABC transporter permease [Halothermothrix orenii]|nr:sugar ABC transporter permease [Halothermothrix orenii]